MCAEGLQGRGLGILFTLVLGNSLEIQRYGRDITVIYPRRAHNPILRTVPWRQMPVTLPGLPGARLALRFQ